MNDLISPENRLSLSAMLEALLFVAPGAVNSAQLATALDLPVEEIERGLEELENIYLTPESGHGLRLQRNRGRVQLTSASAAATAIEL